MVAPIFAGQHVVGPDQAGQRVPVDVTGEAVITGLNLCLQLGVFSGPGSNAGLSRDR